MTSYKFSDTSQEFLRNIGSHGRSRVRPIPISHEFIQPGDVLIFNYESEEDDNTKIVLVVSTQRAPGGLFVSTQGNLLLTCYRVDLISPGLISFILKMLYKNRDQCRYNSTLDGLMASFGGKHFKTYNLFKASKLQELQIAEEELHGEE